MTKVKYPPNSGNVMHLLASTRLLAELPIDALATLANSANRLQVDAGELLFREGDLAEHFLLVCAGRVELLRFTCDGEERVFHLFGAGQLVAEPAMFMPHGRYPMNARAQSACDLYRLRRDALHKACATYPQMAMRMLESLSMRLYRQINEVDWLTASSASQRLAVYLLKLQRHQGKHIEFPISQRQLAIHLGIRPETLSRLLSEWQQAGRLRGRQRQWLLCDLTYLQQLAQAAERTF